MASTAIGLYLQSLPAAAACSFVPTAGDDIYLCDSGTSAGFTDLGGNNTLSLPVGGTGTITSAVTFGAGSDSFTMTSGTLQSLNQGDNLDTFFMSGGHIVGFFDDGDSAVMTGGRIGRVNMLLDDNLFDMSGGTIDNNLVAGFGNDTIILSGGTIGGNISVSGGTDSVTLTGGSVGGNVLMSFGTDTFTWDSGGTIDGSVDLGADNDTARLRNLTSANLAGTDTLTGGLGVDGLTLENVQTGVVARFQSWETINANAGSVLTFDGNLTLGDSGSGTGTLNVDASSTLRGGGTNAAVSAAAPGQLVAVINAGTIDLSDAGASTSDRFTVNGNYTGNGGLLVLNTVLDDDASPSDRVVVSGGTATGTTAVSVVNAGGAGADTLADGIMVVELANGATSAASAFALNGRVAAGAHEYLLYKGGVTAGSEENFYLRSTLVVVPTPTTPPPENVPPIIVDPPAVPPTVPPVVEPEIVILPPGPGVAPPSEDATPVELEIVTVDIGGVPTVVEVVPLYRVEVPTYSAVPQIAEYLALSTLGIFHERRGGWFDRATARERVDVPVLPVSISSGYGGRLAVQILDWIAIILFLVTWVGLEPMMALGWPRRTDSLMLDMVRIRRAWMREVLTRDTNFIGDAAILGHTINSASFFGSANLIVIVAMSSALFIQPTAGLQAGIISMFAPIEPLWLFQCKVLLVMATLLRGLSEFIWAVRQINYCLAAIGASPSRDEAQDIAAWTHALSLMINPALRSFSQGVRSYYFTVAAALWFLGPIAFLVAIVGSVGLLVWRHSWSDTAKGVMEVRKLLDESNPPAAEAEPAAAISSPVANI